MATNVNADEKQRTTMVQIEMTASDFERFLHVGALWKGGSWAQHSDRFETVDTHDGLPSWDWTIANWVGESWANVILARAFLTSVGHDCEILWDMSTEHGYSYVVLTDYLSEHDKNWVNHHRATPVS